MMQCGANSSTSGRSAIPQMAMTDAGDDDATARISSLVSHGYSDPGDWISVFQTRTPWRTRKSRVSCSSSRRLSAESTFDLAAQRRLNWGWTLGGSSRDTKRSRADDMATWGVDDPKSTPRSRPSGMPLSHRWLVYFVMTRHLTWDGSSRSLNDRPRSAWNGYTALEASALYVSQTVRNSSASNVGSFWNASSHAGENHLSIGVLRV